MLVVILILIWLHWLSVLILLVTYLALEVFQLFSGLLHLTGFLFFFNSDLGELHLKIPDGCVLVLDFGLHLQLFTL